MIFNYFFMKTSNLPKSMKFWFPDLGIADLESSGPQLFKNQLFKIFKIQNSKKKYQPTSNNQQPSTITHIYIYIYIYINYKSHFSHNTCFVGLLNFSPASQEELFLEMCFSRLSVPPAPLRSCGTPVLLYIHAEAFFTEAILGSMIFFPQAFPFTTFSFFSN